MSIPVITDKWAGNFDCSSCGRKRLMANEFSKKALEKYRKDRKPLKCKVCIQTAEEAERTAAAARRKNGTQNNSSSSSNDNEVRKCILCQKEKLISDYNRNQWNKGEGKSKCRICVDKALAEESSQLENKKDQKLKDARTKVANAKMNGNKAIILQAESELAALEAELVTGLKPVRMNSRGGGRGGGGGRFRNSALRRGKR